MPVTKLAPDTPLDPPQSGGQSAVTRLPSDAQLDQSSSQPSTTASGLAGSATRGLAPYAAGAGIGAALGAPLGGVGAIPGAIAGMGAVGATELTGDIYNAIARQTGWSQMATPQQLVDKLADKLGIKKPSTPTERLTEEAAGMLPFGATAGGLGEAIVANDAGKVDRFIRSAYERAIKPPSSVAKTAPQLADYRQQARSAIDSILANKPSLRFTGEMGEITGELPKTVEQFGDAIGQTKQAIFEKYDAMARAAGQTGARVDLQPTVGELQKIAADPVVRDLHPELASYAEASAQRLAARGSYSTVDAQRAVQNLNQSLKAFYSNPSYDTASRAGIDDMVANQLRGGLDKAIESATGPGYQELKNEYGALKTIEKHVVQRAIVEGRKNLGGGLLGNIGDLVSADQVIRGVLTLNPADIARGAAVKGFTAFVKKMRDPNRAVEKLFEAAENQKNVREAARDLLPEYSPEKPLALPPPTVSGPGAAWVKAGEGGVMPGGPAFTMKQPSPSALRAPEAEQIKKDIATVARHLERVRQVQPALPAPPSYPALPRPSVIYGPQQEWLATGQGMIPPQPGFTTTP